VLEALQHPLGQGGRHETLPFIRSRVAVPGTDRQPHGGCHAHRDERVPRGIEQRMDYPLPPASQGVCPGPRESEAHQTRHDMQCVQMMLETVPEHGKPLVGPNTGVERVPFACARSRRQWVRSAPYASWKKHISYHRCPTYREARIGAFGETENTENAVR